MQPKVGDYVINHSGHWNGLHKITDVRGSNGQYSLVCGDLYQAFSYPHPKNELIIKELIHSKIGKLLWTT